jgi:hypothetical protein
MNEYINNLPSNVTNDYLPIETIDKFQQKAIYPPKINPINPQKCNTNTTTNNIKSNNDNNKHNNQYKYNRNLGKSKQHAEFKDQIDDSDPWKLLKELKNYTH